MTSDLDSWSRWASVILHLNLKSSILVIGPQVPLNLTSNVLVDIVNVGLCFEETSKVGRVLEEAINIVLV